MKYRWKRDTLCKNKEEIMFIENTFFHIAYADNTKLVLRKVRFLGFFSFFLTKTELAWFKKNGNSVFENLFHRVSLLMNGKH